MKKIIAVLLSINLLVLNASPVLAQVAPRKLAQGIRQAAKVPSVKLPNTQLPVGLQTPVAKVGFGQQIEKAALNGMRLPLTQNYSALLGNAHALLPAARQILLHDNVQERTLLLRSDFVALALANRASPQDISRAADFYREHLQAEHKVLFEGMTLPAVGTVSDIASLGILGTRQDADLIYQTALKAQHSEQEAIVTAAAARALLRLEAYPQLEALSVSSAVQPDLWDGLAQYAQEHQLPLYIYGNENGIRNAVDITDAQQQLTKFGPLNQVAANPSVEATYLYMNAGRQAAPVTLTAEPLASRAQTPVAPKEPLADITAAQEPIAPLQLAPTAVADFTPQEQQLAAIVAEQTLTADKKAFVQQAQEYVKKFLPKGISSADETKFTQRAALYLTAFSIGLEIGTPIMASIKTALNLPLSYAILVTVASYSPYLFGSFIANWLKTKIGRKGTINAGLGLMGGSFALGAAALGLDGSFIAWDNPLAQYFSILGALTAASTGAVFIHNAAGPIMTEISKTASDLVRQQRGTYIELSRSVGMIASFAFPFLATSMLGMDWSAPFVMALPFVGASALALNVARLPNSKPQMQAAAAPKLVQSPVMNGARKPRKSMTWKNSILNNSYVRLLREEPGVGSFITALFLMNAVEVAFQSGFLFMIPQLTSSESAQYLFGMAQYAVAFLAGRYLAGHFLKWFPNRNISVATLMSAVGGVAALGATHNAYALTAALFTAELGISTAFTLAFARTAKNHLTQDRVTSLIMATAVACAVGPLVLTQIAESLINVGIMSEGDATIAALVAVPSVLALLSAKLFRRMENKTIPNLKDGLQNWLAKVKQFFTKK